MSNTCQKWLYVPVMSLTQSPTPSQNWLLYPVISTVTDTRQQIRPNPSRRSCLVFPPHLASVACSAVSAYFQSFKWMLDSCGQNGRVISLQVYIAESSTVKCCHSRSHRKDRSSSESPTQFWQAGERISWWCHVQFHWKSTSPHTHQSVDQTLPRVSDYHPSFLLVYRRPGHETPFVSYSMVDLFIRFVGLNITKY